MTALVKGTACQAMAAPEAPPYGGAMALGTVGSGIASTSIGPLASKVLRVGVRSRFVDNEHADPVSELLLGFLKSPTVPAQRS